MDTFNVTLQLEGAGKLVVAVLAGSVDFPAVTLLPLKLQMVPHVVLGASPGDPSHDKIMQNSRDSLGHPIHDKVMRKSPDKQGLRTRRTPWTCLSIYPKTRLCLSYYFTSFTNSFSINRGLSPTTFLWKELT